MLIIAGNVQNAVKLAQLDEKWKKKKESEKEQKKKELTPEMRQLMQYQEDIERIREGNPMASIDTKLKSGAELTPDEIEYLKKNHPQAYQEYEEIKREKEAYKSQLKKCKTKEEVERIKLSKMGSFMAEAKSISQNPNIPKAKKLGLMEKLLKKTMAIYKIHIKFTKSLAFQNLPTEEEKREEEEASEGSVCLKGADFMKEEGDAKAGEEADCLDELDRLDLNKELEEIADKEAEDLEQLESAKGRKRWRSSGETGGYTTFEETKTVILNYLIANREIGGGLEYIKSDLEQVENKGKISY